MRALRLLRRGKIRASGGKWQTNNEIVYVLWPWRVSEMKAKWRLDILVCWFSQSFCRWINVIESLNLLTFLPPPPGWWWWLSLRLSLRRNEVSCVNSKQTKRMRSKGKLPFVAWVVAWCNHDQLASADTFLLQIVLFIFIIIQPCISTDPCYA